MSLRVSGDSYSDHADQHASSEETRSGSESRQPQSTTVTRTSPDAAAAQNPAEKHDKPLAIHFGGNAGTCEGLARELATTADAHGFTSTIASLDEATEHVPNDRPVVIITASYEGLPAANAKRFVYWLEGLKKHSDHFRGTKYAVFGVGNSAWASNFQRVPRLVDELIGNNGASRIVESGFADVKAELIGTWEEWLETLLNALTHGQAITPKPEIQVEFQAISLNSLFGGSEMQYGTVMSNRELSDTEIGPAKRHMDVKLPAGVEYRTGDSIIIQPRNPSEVVYRVTSFFSLDFYDKFSVTGSAKKHLPTQPTFVGDFLSSAVELAAPITKRQLRTIVSHVPDEHPMGLHDIIISQYRMLAENSYSILDVLEEFSLDLPFATYIDMLPALSSRQYNISSSSLAYPKVVSLTFDVHTSPAYSGHGIFRGACSTYLASRHIGDPIACGIRATNADFRMPTDLSTPVIMIAAGTGVAPMRAFIQERASIAETRGTTTGMGSAILYFGCKDHIKDFIYKSELQAWSKNGLVKLRPAFSEGGHHEYRYVQELIWEDREEMADLFDKGAQIYLCGSAARLGRTTAEVCKRIWRERSEGRTEAMAEEWLAKVRMERYIGDVH